MTDGRHRAASTVCRPSDATQITFGAGMTSSLRRRYVMAAPAAAIDFGHGLNGAWDNIAAFVPKFLVFLVILLIAWLVAKALAKLVDVVLERVGFDRAVERGGVARAMERT